VLLLAALLITGLMLRGQQATSVARFGAIGAGLGILASLIADFRAGGLRSLIRADVLALASLYFLTLFEFLFPQEDFDTIADVLTTHHAVIACLWGIAGVGIGRHLGNLRCAPLETVFARPISQGWMIVLFWGCFAVGFLHMLIAVDFNVVDLVEYFVAPRFQQPWGRGQFGDWKALFNELGMLLYLIPPMMGVMLARRSRYGKTHLLLMFLGFLFLLFYGFSSGTRNIFHTYIATFLIAYSFAATGSQKREVVAVSSVCVVLILVCTVVMLQFRNVGLKLYIVGGFEKPSLSEQTMHVDRNLDVICKIIEAFPRQHRFLGLEVPYLAIIRPIPRALWPGKPMGMTVSIEEVFGEKGAGEDYTVAASIVGESYMMGGVFAVLATCAVCGLLAGWWNQFASARSSEFGILVYASGFFAAVITMRSLLVFTTALLPTFAAIVLGSIIAATAQGAPAQPAGRANVLPNRVRGGKRNDEGRTTNGPERSAAESKNHS
jgi:hypothetical protein